MRLVPSLVLLVLLALLACTGADAETLSPRTDEGGPTLSSGQPPRWRLGIGPLVGGDFQQRSGTGRLFLDAEGRIAMPQFGLLDLHLEGALDRDRAGFGTAIGGYAKLPYVRVGVERDLDAHRFDLTLSAQGSLRRGGMFHRGERLRIDYTPARERIQVGFVFNTPWLRYRATRPYDIHARLPHGPLPLAVPADASRVDAGDMERIAHAMDWLDRLLTPNLIPQGYSSSRGRRAFEHEIDALMAHQDQVGHDFAGEDSAYHAGLDLAFARAAGGDARMGTALARDAESVVFHDILLPFDREFTRPRRAEGLDGLGRIAQDHFEKLVRTHAGTGEDVAPAAAEVFRRVVLDIDGVARAARKRWGGGLAWLPLNYGLRPEQYDSQAEIEDVVGQIEGHAFSRANTIRYILNDQFYYELRQMIRETKQYHVLWVHDFRGRNDHKAPDRVAWTQATEGYVEAFTEAVRAMDRGERTDLPYFFVFLDEHYYEVNESRQLITMLENLDRARVPHLKDPALRGRLEAALRRLRDVVRQSPALAARGDDYLRRRMRVQVEITYPLDPSYAGDMLMRDHRKLAFRDVSESDPTAGCGVFTGEGVGEHYEGPYWEDRSLLVRGAALVRLKAEARGLLLSQGFRDDEIPYCLRSRAEGEHAAETLDSLRAAGWSDDLLITMNQTGWGAKQATVLKAILYNLMPRGAIMIAPDSLWTSDYWAGMFVSAALRGCRVYVIAPAADHAPSSSLPALGLMQETLSALFRAQERFAPLLARAHGALHVGLYTRDSDVSDMRTQLKAILEAPRDASLYPPEIRLHPDVLRALQAEYDTLRSAYAGPAHPLPGDRGGKPQIHLKAQFYASKEALGMLARPEWGPILARYLAVRRRQTASPETGLEDLSASLLVAGDAPAGAPLRALDAYRDSVLADRPGEAERIFCLATVGSHNQDRRSMMFDGEALVAVLGPGAILTAIDFAGLLETATWPRTSDELNSHFPKSGSVMKSLGHWIRNLI